jgi:hypothetical protein
MEERRSSPARADGCHEPIRVIHEKVMKNKRHWREPAQTQMWRIPRVEPRPLDHTSDHSGWNIEANRQTVIQSKGRGEMERLVAISLAGALFAAAGLAQSSYIGAKQTNEAFREESMPQAAPRTESATRTNPWLEQWFKTKYGRNSPMEEARQRATYKRTNEAFREDTTAQAALRTEAAARTNPWLEQWFKTKYGRNSPMEEARQRAARPR